MIKLQRRATEEELKSLDSWYCTIFLPCEYENGQIYEKSFTENEYDAQLLFEELVNQGADPKTLEMFATVNYRIGSDEAI
jgi:hypothetical protein